MAHILPLIRSPRSNPGIDPLGLDSPLRHLDRVIPGRLLTPGGQTDPAHITEVGPFDFLEGERQEIVLEAW